MFNALLNAKYKRVIIISILGVAMGLTVNALLGLVNTFGYKIPSANISSDYIKGIFVAFLLLAITMAAPIRRKDQIVLSVLWILRCSITLIFMLYYEYYYALDAFNYFRDLNSETFYFEPQLFNGTAMINWLGYQIKEHIFFLNSYHALKVLWSFMGLAGAYYCYRAVCLMLGRSDLRFLWFFGLFPSMLFWSSIFGKDPITFLGLGMFLYGSIGALKQMNRNYLFHIVVGLIIVAYIRIWLVPIMLTPLGVVYMIFNPMRVSAKIVVTALIIFSSFFIGNRLLQEMQVYSIGDVVQRTQMVSRSWAGKGGSAQEIPEFTSVADMAKFLPMGMFTALFRPLPGEVLNPFGILAGLENIVLLVMFVWALWQVKSYSWRDPMIMFPLLAIVFWAMFYSFTSSQNLGTAVRFKLQILPCIVFIPIYVKYKLLSRET